MPLYEYLCEACGRRAEVLQRLDDVRLSVCPECGGPLRKLFSAPAFQFKGSGWYVTDYARSNAKDSATSAPTASGGAAKSEGAAPSDSGAGKSEGNGGKKPSTPPSTDSSS